MSPAARVSRIYSRKESVARICINILFLLARRWLICRQRFKQFLKQSEEREKLCVLHCGVLQTSISFKFHYAININSMDLTTVSAIPWVN